MKSHREPDRNEPDLTTAPELAPELADVLRELSEREPIFHRLEHGRTRADFERMTDDNFWETGASGRRYSRAAVLDELERRHGGAGGRQGTIQDDWETSEFCCRRLAGEVFLLTYTLVQKPAGGERRTRRATIWERTAEGWKILYHQGTLVE